MLQGISSKMNVPRKAAVELILQLVDGWLIMGLLPPPLGNFADISYLVEN